MEYDFSGEIEQHVKYGFEVLVIGSNGFLIRPLNRQVELQDLVFAIAVAMQNTDHFELLNIEPLGSLTDNLSSFSFLLDLFDILLASSAVGHQKLAELTLKNVDALPTILLAEHVLQGLQTDSIRI